jgi:zinc protease
MSFPKKRKVDSLKFPALKNFNIPVIQKAESKNGIKIRLIKTDKLPLVNIVAIIKGGSVYDPTRKIGLADMTSQILRIGGVAEMDGEKVDAYLDSNGITISINTTLENFTIYMSCLDEKLEQAFEILSKILKTPGFDKKKLEEIKTQFASSVQRRNDNPQPILSREFDKVVYGENTPFSSVLEYEHIDNITMQDIKNEYKRFFAPNNILMGVSGPVNLKIVNELINKYLGDWNTRAMIPEYPKVKKPVNDFKIAIANKDNLNQNYISIGNMGFSMDKKSEAAIKVFNSIFSQGMDSRLFNKVRTKLGLTYGISGAIVQNEWYPGKVYYSTFTKSESTIPVIKAIFEEIDRIKKERVSDEELKNAKDYFLNSYVFKFSSPE